MLTTSNYPRRCRTGGIPSVSISAAPGALLSRSKLPLRSYYKPKSIFNFTHIENAPFSRPKRFKARKINSNPKMDLGKKKLPDYTETAYREAVSRLKYLLAESYSPRTSGKLVRDRQFYRRSNSRIHESADDTDDRSAISDCSKGLSGNLSSRINTFTTSEKHLPPVTSQLIGEDSQLSPKELTSLVMRQEEYIEHLEQESGYCKDELRNLLAKIREVVAENEALHDKKKAGLLKSFLNEFENPDEVKRVEKTTISDTESPFGTGKKIKHQIIEGPSIMYESRISELEAQLTQAKIELKNAQEENQSRIVRMSENFGPPNSDTLAQLDQVMREKRETNLKLEDTLRELQIARERETESLQKAKRAKESVQQAIFDKSQAEVEIRRLKDELDRQREKIRDATQETSRRLAEERHQVERRYSQQVEQLSNDVATHWDAASKSQLEIDKQRREISDLKRELAQKQALIDDLKKELQSKISNLQSDLNQMIAEKDAADQEVATAKLAAERYERQVRQEQNRWQTEINSYKQRLERADADIVHCRRENLRLSEQIASLEKELNMSKLTLVPDTQAPSATPRLDGEKDLTTMIKDMETKHEGADEMNNTGAVKLSTSPSKTKRTVKVDLKFSISPKKKSVVVKSDKTPLSTQEEMARLQNNIEYLSNRIRDTFENPKGRSSKTPDADPTVDALVINDDASSNNKNISNPGIESYSPAGHENYAHNYDNQQHTNQELEATNYELPVDNQNYQDYSAHDQNYPAEYSNENYEQYEQYDPSLYENQPSDDHHQQDDNQINTQQHYDNYPNEAYIPDQQQQPPQGQQYVEPNTNDNVLKS